MLILGQILGKSLVSACKRLGRNRKNGTVSPHRRHTSCMIRGRWLLFVKTERHEMICKKHPRIAKSSFLVMVNVALECVCVCALVCKYGCWWGWKGREKWSYLLEGLLASSAWLLLFPKRTLKKRTFLPLLPTRSCFCLYGNVRAQHTVIPCNQKTTE